MLLQYHKINNDDSDRIQLLIIVAMEFILLVSEIVAIIVAGINFTRYQLHFNLKCIFGYTVLAYYFDIMARSVIMGFEVGVLKLEDEIIEEESQKWPWKLSNPYFILLFLCSIYRVYFMCLICSLTLLLAVERYFATIWVASYESKKYKSVSFLLVGTNIVAGFIASMVFHYELLFNLISVVSLGLFLNIVSILLFWTLHSLNKTNMEVCQNRDIQQSYTLSLRFQLNENLKIMKWLQNCILVVTVSNTLLAGFLVVSNHAHLKENYPVLVKYCHSFLNFGIAVYAQVAFCVCALADRNFRQYFLRFEIIRIFLKPFFGRIFPEDFKIKETLSTSEETNVYFSKLSLQWDDTMMKNVKGVVKKRKKFLICF
ncbi:hypothetical protein L3Y34_017254 [Caenorhabditis briggsae]|uniref:Uncharacterized protein n=1 Tax=Caenorhabditis briggsae TaxID=6238 RepID=A0AAE9ISR1_CAEBR|nr:hypothetical protein L3Y34_017254 [Caenorhabditis briggsae]